MKLSFLSRKKMGFINGQIIKPVDQTNQEFDAWVMVNGLVLS